MELRLGLSLLLLLTYFSSSLSKNIRDGPNFRQRHNKRATPSEFLQPPAPSGKILRSLPPRNLAPPPPPLPPPPPSSIRTGRFITNSGSSENGPSRGYFSRLLGWLNPWSTNGGLEPPPQSFNRPPGHPSDEQLSVPHGPFHPERSCNPCNDVPWIPIRGLVDGPLNRDPQNLNLNLGGGYYVPSPSHEVREPDFAYPPAQNLYPGPMISNHPIPNPHIYPGAIPPLYRAEPFSTAGNDHFPGSQQVPGSDFQHRKESSNFGPPLDSGGASTNIQESVQGQGIQIHDDEGQGIQGQGNQGHGIQGQGIQGQGNQDQSQGVQEGIQVQESQEQRIQVQGNQGQGILGQESHAQGILGQENQGQGILGQENQGQRLLGQENQGQGILGQGNQGQGILGQGNQGQGILGQGNQDQGILDPETQAQGILGLETQGQGILGPETHGQGTPYHQGQVNKIHQGQSVQSNQGQRSNSHQGQGNNSHQGQGSNIHQGQGTNSHQGQETISHQGQGTNSHEGQGSNSHHGQGSNIHQGQGSKNHQIQGQQTQNQQFHSQPELVRSTGGQVSSEQIHLEKSPLIDLSVSSISSTPLTLTEVFSTASSFGSVSEASTKPSSLIDYLVSGYDDKIPTTGVTGTESTGSAGPVKETGSVEASGLIKSNGSSGPTGSTGTDLQSQGQSQESYGELGYNDKQPFLEALMESYYNFKKDESEATLRDSKASAINSESTGTSGGDDLSLETPSSRAVKRNKQVQIIIPYTSQYTPSPFHPSFVDNKNGREIDHHLPRKVPSGIQFEHFYDHAVAQESKTVPVTSLPEISSSSVTPAETNGKNNSIDVQRLQKNIDNWTIQEYSKSMVASTVLPNATRPYLYPSKKIPDEYFTTMEPNNTSSGSDEIYDEEAKRVSSEFDFEDYKQMSTFEISRITQESKSTTTPQVDLNSQEPTNSINKIEAKENATESSTRKNENDLWKVYPVFPSTTTVKKIEKVYVVTPIPFGQKESKKAVDVDLKKKPKKKEPERIERAYQVLPQAVNNLAVASTGPDSRPLWGIMEHEEFASSNSDSESQLPILYTGHSKVSHARR